MTTLEKRAEDLVIAVLAELAKQGVETLRMGDKDFHQHFGMILKKFSEGPGELQDLARQFYKNIVNGTYDELDHALITAEQFGFVKFPNPSYSRLTISITPRMAHHMLKEWTPEERVVLEAAARELNSCQRLR
ncbi:MAG TPA: hypothetical protein VGM67_06325 [Gemmatimonadaceae bacterium]|jgi:hypothetical protein